MACPATSESRESSRLPFRPGGRRSQATPEKLSREQTFVAEPAAIPRLAQLRLSAYHRRGRCLFVSFSHLIQKAALYDRVCFKRAVVKLLAARALKPGDIFRVFGSLQKFFVILDRNK